MKDHMAIGLSLLLGMALRRVPCRLALEYVRPALEDVSDIEYAPDGEASWRESAPTQQQHIIFARNLPSKVMSE